MCANLLPHTLQLPNQASTHPVVCVCVCVCVCMCVCVCVCCPQTQRERERGLTFFQKREEERKVMLFAENFSPFALIKGPPTQKISHPHTQLCNLWTKFHTIHTQQVLSFQNLTLIPQIKAIENLIRLREMPTRCVPTPLPSSDTNVTLP